MAMSRLATRGPSGPPVRLSAAAAWLKMSYDHLAWLAGWFIDPYRSRKGLLRVGALDKSHAAIDATGPLRGDPQASTWPARMTWRCGSVQSGEASTPPLTLFHSITTTPLKRLVSFGRRTTRRVTNGAAVSALARHRPSVVRSPERQWDAWLAFQQKTPLRCNRGRREARRRLPGSARGRRRLVTREDVVEDSHGGPFRSGGGPRGLAQASRSSVYPASHRFVNTRAKPPNS